jgi:broad specificity phosphatase PhoE
MAIPTVVLVRHGETELNKQGMLRGWTDVPLDSKGQKEAAETGKEVAEEWPITKIYAANLRRVMQSTEPLEKDLGIKADFVQDLRPWNGGVLAGRKVPNIEEKIRYYINHPTKAPEEGEPMKEFLQRLLHFMSGVFDEANEADGPIAVVTSIRPIEAIIGYIEAGMNDTTINPDRLEAKKETVPPSGVVVLTNPKKRDDWKVSIWKDGGGRVGAKG